MRPDIDLLVVTGRIAAEHDRAVTERLGQQARLGSRGHGLRTSLGRRLVDVGLFVAGDPAWNQSAAVADRTH